MADREKQIEEELNILRAIRDYIREGVQILLQIHHYQKKEAEDDGVRVRYTGARTDSTWNEKDVSPAAERKPRHVVDGPVSLAPGEDGRPPNEAVERGSVREPDFIL